MGRHPRRVVDAMVRRGRREEEGNEARHVDETKRACWRARRATTTTSTPKVWRTRCLLACCTQGMNVDIHSNEGWSHEDVYGPGTSTAGTSLRVLIPPLHSPPQQQKNRSPPTFIRLDI